MRIIKTVIAVFLCFVIDLLLGYQAPFYSVIAAILCMQQDARNSLAVALERTIGTLIGGVWGLLILLLMQLLSVSWQSIVQYAIISLFLIPVIYSTVLLRQTGATYITCVVYLCITVVHAEDVNPLDFAVGRVVATLIGIAVSLLVNLLFGGNKKKDAAYEEAAPEKNKP